MNYYKRLTNKELKELEKDFIKFLIINGITGEDWSKMQKEQPEKADSIVDEFSGTILESSLRRAQHLIMVDDHNVRCFQCGKEKITYISLEYKKDAPFSFHDVSDLNSTLSLEENHFNLASISKAYAKKREFEMYDMIQAGCKISDGKVYKLLALHWAEIHSQQN